MSLKAKLEAVIYAAEEPVTLTQLAALFASDALEWKAAQAAAAQEHAAEVAAETPSSIDPLLPLPLLSEGLEYLGLSDTPAVYAGTGAAAQAVEPAPEPTTEPVPEPPSEPAVAQADGESASIQTATDSPDEPTADPAPDAPVDIEIEARRLARLRDREVKAILKQLLDELIASSSADGRGVEIREIAGGYRMATKPECHDAVRLFVKSLKPALKLSLPALETLAVVAYKQPVTAPEVNEIRGVESAGVLGSLLARKLIATAGRKQVIGRPILYKTTREFLLRFGLKDVNELPSMEEFEKMAAIELEEPSSSETEADEAAENASARSSMEDTPEADLESNSPSGEELAGVAEADALPPTNAEQGPPPAEAVEPPAASDPPEGPAPTTTGDPGTQEAAPAKPDETEQAETETSPHGEESQEKP